MFKEKHWKQSLLCGAVFAVLQSHSLFVHAADPVVANTGESKVLADNETIDTGSTAVQANNGGNVTVGNNVTLSTSGSNRYGLYALNVNPGNAAEQSVINAGAGLNITTNGNGSHGVYANANASSAGARITIGNNATITLNSNNVRGILASDGTDGHVSVEVGDNLQINTVGTNATAVEAQNAAHLVIGDNARLTVTGSSSGVLGADNNSTITLGNDARLNSVVTAVTSDRGSTIRLGDRAEVSTTSAVSSGLNANGNNNGPTSHIIAGDDLTVSTLEYWAFGLYVSGNALIETGNNTTITTEGEDGVGMLSVGSMGRIKVGDNTRITTSGDGGSGIEAQNGSEIAVGALLNISTSGDSATGVYAYNTGSSVAIDSINQISTTGQAAHAFLARRRSNIAISGGSNSIITTGEAAHALYATEGASIDLSGTHRLSVDSSLGSAAILAQGSQTYGNSTITAQGQLNINGGLIAGDYADVTVNLLAGSLLNGFTSVSDMASTLDLAMADSTWNLTDDFNGLGNSFLSSLDIINSNIDLSQVGLGSRLTTRSLSGSGGVFTLKTDLASLVADQLVVTGTSSGDHLLLIRDSGTAQTTGEELLTVVQTADGGAQFSLTQSVDAGGFEYGLRRAEDDNNNWELYATGKVSRPGDASINSFIGAYLLSSAETDTLLKRMGDLRSNPAANGAWIRVHGGKFKSGDSQYLKRFDMKYGGIQVGADRSFELNDGGNFFLGASFAYGNGKLDHQSGRTDVDSKALAVYGSYVNPNGPYADLVMKYMWMNSDFKTLVNTGEMVLGDKIDTGGFGASLEIGNRFYLQDPVRQSGWYVEPQAQVSYLKQNGDRFTASNGRRVHVSGYESLQGRLGLASGFQLPHVARPQNFYAKVSVVKEFKGDIEANFNGTSVSTSFDDTWCVYGLGYTAQVGPLQHVYLDIERSSGGHFRQPFQINAGFRLSF